MNAEGKPWISLERRRLREHLIEGEGNEPKDDQRLKYRKKRRDDQINEGKFNWGSKVETNRQRERMSTERQESWKEIRRDRAVTQRRDCRVGEACQGTVEAEGLQSDQVGMSHQSLPSTLFEPHFRKMSPRLWVD